VDGQDLTRLWQQQGERAEAYELLAPIYGWFTDNWLRVFPTRL